MPDQTSLIPIILIDSSKARKLDISIVLQKIYYQPSGYQRTIKQLYTASNNLGYDFTFDEVRNWLERQAVHQIYKLGQNIFHELDLTLSLYLMMYTRQMFCICPMTRLDV